MTLGMALFASSGTVAFAAIALGALLHAVEAWRQTRTGAIFLAASALLCFGASAAMAGAQLTAAFLLSCLAVALRAGVLPFHVGCCRALRPCAGRPDAATGLRHSARLRAPAIRGPSCDGGGAGAAARPLRCGGLLHRRPDDPGAARSARIVSGHDRHARRHAARGHGCRQPRELRGGLAGGRRHGTGPWRAGPRHYVARSARRPGGFRRTWRTCADVPTACRGICAVRWRGSGFAGDGWLRGGRPAAAHAVDGESGQHRHRQSCPARCWPWPRWWGSRRSSSDGRPRRSRRTCTPANGS